MRSSLKIKNAWIADGTGSPLVKGELLVAGGRISGFGSGISGSCAADREIDLEGRILAPGFIDAHGHSDVSLFARPEGFSKVSQGITTEIAGNCGLCAFLTTGLNRAHLQELYAQYRVPFDWHDLDSYRERLRALHPAMDLAVLCGHNTLRAAVAGYEKENLSGAELREMCRMLDETLRAGALGLSAGLLYVPGKFSDREEQVELMRVVAAHDKIFTTHLRSEGAALLESLEETFDAARAAGLKKVQISHFKTAGRANWGKLCAALDLIERARADGIRVTVDRYPYLESMTQLSVILPDEWSDLDDVSIENRLRSAEERRGLVFALRASRTPEYWQSVRLVSTTGKHAADCGKKLAELSRDPAEFVVELLAHDSAGTTAAFAGMSRENLETILSLDYCMAGSDGNALPPDDSLGSTHWRAFGAIARFLRMRLDAADDIAQSVRRVTGLPAETFRLDDAGKIAVGRRADLAAFDPDGIDGASDASNPRRPAKGILFTLKDGEFVYRP